MDPADPLVVYVGTGAKAIAEASMAALGRDADVTTCRVSFEEALSTGSGGVACLRGPTPEDVAWLSSLRLRRPHAPLVLVTPLVPVSLRVIPAPHAGTPPVVWAQELFIGLAPTLSEEVGRDAVRRIAGLLRGAAAGTPVVARTLNRMVQASPPINQVRHLANSLNVARETLYDQAASGPGVAIGHTWCGYTGTPPRRCAPCRDPIGGRTDGCACRHGRDVRGVWWAADRPVSLANRTNPWRRGP